MQKLKRVQIMPWAFALQMNHQAEFSDDSAYDKWVLLKQLTKYFWRYPDAAITKHSLQEAPKEWEMRNNQWQNKCYMWNHRQTKKNCNKGTTLEQSEEKLLWEQEVVRPVFFFLAQNFSLYSDVTS